MRTAAALVAVLILAVGVLAQVLPKQVGSIDIASPSFLEFVPDAHGALALVVTSFSGSPFTKGSVWVLPRIAAAIADADGNWSALQLGPLVGAACDSFEWPNEITPVPRSGTPFPAGSFLVSDGFLVPGKGAGSVSVVTLPAAGQGFGDGCATVTSLTEGDQYFYHRATFVDINGDGLLDVITARAEKPVFGSGSGQLVWLEQPSSAASSAPWTAHVIMDGPDISFYVLPLNGSRSLPLAAPVVVYSAEFFAQRISAVIVDQGGQAKASSVLDASIGEGYDVKPLAPPFPFEPASEPLSAPSLLVTNYQYWGTGSLFLYSIDPETLVNATNRTTVSSVFKNVQDAPGSGSPGFVFPHYPFVNQTSGMPNVFVCGDGSEQLYLFAPDSVTGQLRLVLTQQYGSTVGSMTFADLDGDGAVEALVSSYNEGKIWVWSYGGAQGAMR